MEQDQFVFFWGGPFSQWAKYSMVIAGVEYVTCEQYMMAEKARLFGDKETEEAIMATRNPRDQKALGRKIKGFDKALWESICVETVYQGNLAKFSQHPELAEMLLATNDKVIAEASPSDIIWGIGMAEDNPYVTDMTRWGTNLLGKVIMRVRATLKSTMAPATVSQPHID